VLATGTTRGRKAPGKLLVGDEVSTDLESIHYS
jgi:hypothetical protein